MTHSGAFLFYSKVSCGRGRHWCGEAKTEVTERNLLAPPSRYCDVNHWVCYRLWYMLSNKKDTQTICLYNKIFRANLAVKIGCSRVQKLAKTVLSNLTSKSNIKCYFTSTATYPLTSDKIVHDNSYFINHYSYSKLAHSTIKLTRLHTPLYSKRPSNNVLLRSTCLPTDFCDTCKGLSANL